jgi:hypothetical protein
MEVVPMERVKRSCILFGVAVLGWPLGAPAQRVVRVPDEVESASVMAVQVDPATRVVVAQMPRPIERTSTLEALGLAPDRLKPELAVIYSPTRLEDEAGRLAVFYVSLLKEGNRWIFWSDDLAKETQRLGPELQVTFDTERDTRYLADFVLDSAEQEFAVVAEGTRTSQTASEGHIAVVVTGTGRPQTVRVLPTGDAQTQARRFTFFHVVVTPLN